MFARALRAATLVAALFTTAGLAGAQANDHVAGVGVTAAATTTPADFAGVYTIAIRRTADDFTDARLLVERHAAGTSALLVTSDGTAAVTGLTVTEDGALRGTVRTEDGLGVLTLRRTGDTIEGSVVVGKQAWQIHGTLTA